MCYSLQDTNVTNNKEANSDLALTFSLIFGHQKFYRHQRNQVLKLTFVSYRRSGERGKGEIDMREVLSTNKD